MPVTSPDSIYYSDTSTTLDLNAISAAEATSVQQALDLRERFSFVWANATERTNQTGMVTGSTGYEVDTKTEYIYENSVWRLARSFAQFTGTSNMINGAVAPFWGSPTALTINSAASTDTAFATTGFSVFQYINFVDAGIYSISWDTIVTGTPAGTLQQFAFVNNTTDAPQAITSGIVVASQVHIYTSMPFIRATGANFKVYLMYYQGTTGTPSAKSTINVGRLG